MQMKSVAFGIVFGVLVSVIVFVIARHSSGSGVRGSSNPAPHELVSVKCTVQKVVGLEEQKVPFGSENFGRTAPGGLSRRLARWRRMREIMVCQDNGTNGRLLGGYLETSFSGTGVHDLSGLKSSIFLNSSSVSCPRSFS